MKNWQRFVLNGWFDGPYLYLVQHTFEPTQSCKLNELKVHETSIIKLFLGSFANYVDKILAFLTTYPPALTFHMVYSFTISGYPPTSPCKHSLWMTTLWMTKIAQRVTYINWLWVSLAFDGCKIDFSLCRRCSISQ